KHTREELLAVLITGWVLGPAVAETSEATASRCWDLRERLLEYQRTANAIDRKKLLEQIERYTHFSIPEVAQAISLLPPADAAETTELQLAPGATARKTKVAWSNHGQFNYSLLLPPEYNPN